MFPPCRSWPSVVDADVFLDGFFQFFFYFRLRLAKDIFDDGFAGFRIVTDCVPALPTSVFSFSDVPLAVCSSFWHDISPFRNEQYRNQGNKATESRTVIRKLSFEGDALSLSMAAHFLRCRRRSSLVTAVRFSNGQEAFPLTTAAQNMYDLR